jgi:hypothetical protein
MIGFFRMSRRLILLVLLAFVGCKVEPVKPPLVQTVVVLPFDSESNNVDAPDIMQRLTFLALKNSPYQVSDIDETNKKLADVGIVDGGQLPAVDPIKLGKDLGVQALLYGYVESFGSINIGFYMQRKVSVSLKMVDVLTGQTLWENSGTGATRQVTLDKNEAQANLAAGLATKLVEKMFNSPLEEEARIATINALRTLPGFSFHGFATDSKTPSHLKKGSEAILKNVIINKK